MTTILILALVFVSILYFFSILKNRNKNKKINTILSDLKKPIRYGYFIRKLKITNKIDPSVNVDFEAFVYVKEIDRFTNGISKIEIDKIEFGVSKTDMAPEKIDEFIRSEVKSLKKTNDIDWLDSEESIKEMRRSKLEKLKEVLQGK
jgi:hypothetical protein